MTTIDTDTDRGYLIDAFLGARTILSEPGAWCQQNLEPPGRPGRPG